MKGGRFDKRDDDGFDGLVQTAGLTGAPMVFRMLALCRVSRIIIISVRRILRETEIEKYGDQS